MIWLIVAVFIFAGLSNIFFMDQIARLDRKIEALQKRQEPEPEIDQAPAQKEEPFYGFKR